MIGFFIICKFFEDFYFCMSVGQYVNEVVDDDCEVVIQVVEDIVVELFGVIGIGDFDVIEFDFFVDSVFDQFFEKVVFM